MFEQGIPRGPLLRPGKYIASQDVVTVFKEPSNDSASIAKLNKASVVEITASPEDSDQNWRSVRTLVGTPGFIKSSAVLTTIEVLQQQRKDFQSAMMWGVRNLFMGGTMAILGSIVGLYALFHGVRLHILVGMIGTGCGESYWGFEQRANAAHAIRKFDQESQAVLTYSARDNSLTVQEFLEGPRG